MDNSQAIRPNFYQDFTSGIEEIKEEPVIDENQQALSYITQFKGWKLLKEYEVRLENYLDELVSEAMSKGLSMTDIGERTMVKELTKFVLRSLISKAEDAKRQQK